jgi:transcriptional regulator with XRE-family HTH domain
MLRKSIRVLRRERRWSQRELARRIGVSHMSVSHWETSRNEPSARQLRALSEAFGVPMETIAFEREAAQQVHERVAMEGN